MIDKEATINSVRGDIAAIRDFVIKAEALCEVVQRFDGRIFSKRLETAMKAVYPVKVTNGYSWRSIKITGWVNSRILRNQIFFGTAKDAFDNNKRINAEILIRKIRETADHHKKMAEEMEEQIGRIDGIIAEYNIIQDKRRKFEEETNWAIREYFGMDL